MRILLLCHAFNGLSQRLHAELRRRSHEVSVEFDISDEVTREAVALFAPQLVLAPFLKRRIPRDVWQQLPCFIVHPGPPGDRGPSSLDYALQEGAHRWGVTVLQADDEFDAGPVWASASFAMRTASKSSLYRNEVTAAAVVAVLEALTRFERGESPQRVLGAARPLLRQTQRAIDWASNDTTEVLRRICAADSSPGLLDSLDGQAYRLFDAADGCAARKSLAAQQPELAVAPAGALLGHDGRALLRATVDGAVWIGRLQRVDAQGAPGPRLPATEVLEAAGATLPAKLPPMLPSAPQPLRSERHGDVQLLCFDFHNGVLGSRDCYQLIESLRALRAEPARVLLLAGGADFWCNGIDLQRIEAAVSPADESWRNIQAIDDVAEEILRYDDRLVVSVLRGNAGAGGAFLALAADEIWAREGVVLNLHYRNMGNLYGSEYWTYLLPRRIGADATRAVMAERLPLLADMARERGVIDALCGRSPADCMELALQRATELAADPRWATRVSAKREARARDEAIKPLADYRREELEQMRRSFYGFDTSYHVARSRFVSRAPHSWTPRHLAVHRQDRGAAQAPGSAGRSPRS
jgi:putative two-component system hydrogenase maturation factor HypX/HoxX